MDPETIDRRNVIERCIDALAHIACRELGDTVDIRLIQRREMTSHKTWKSKKPEFCITDVLSVQSAHHGCRMEFPLAQYADPNHAFAEALKWLRSA